MTPAIGDLVPDREGAYERILVPMKLGIIGEEVLGDGAQARRGAALRRPRDPRDPGPDGEAVRRPDDRRGGAGRGLARRGESCWPPTRASTIEARIVRARAIGEAIVDEAGANDVDLIVLGSAPRWRRQSRFFSPTVDYVLRKAPCEVMVIAYPQGVLEEALA